MMITKKTTTSKNIIFFFIIYISLFFLIFISGNLVYCFDNTEIILHPTLRESIVLNEFNGLIENTEDSRFYALSARSLFEEIDTNNLEQARAALQYIDFNIINILTSHDTLIDYLRNFTLNYPDFDKGYLRDFFPRAHTAFDDNFHILRRMKTIIFDVFNFERPTIDGFLEESTGRLTNAENAINNQRQVLRDIHGTIDWGSVESLSGDSSDNNNSLLNSDTNSSTTNSDINMSD